MYFQSFRLMTVATFPSSATWHPPFSHVSNLSPICSSVFFIARQHWSVEVGSSCTWPALWQISYGYTASQHDDGLNTHNVTRPNQQRSGSTVSPCMHKNKPTNPVFSGRHGWSHPFVHQRLVRSSSVCLCLHWMAPHYFFFVCILCIVNFYSRVILPPVREGSCWLVFGTSQLQSKSLHA